MSDDRIDQPGAVRPGEELDTVRLAAFLRAAIPGAAGELTVAQFPRGYSNLTYLLRLGEQELVLRRPPFGANIKSAHDMGRERRILGALAEATPRFAAPRPLTSSEDPAIIGAPFYVMERVRGIILRTQPPAGLDLTAELMAGMCAALVGGLADLHRLDYAAAGLGDLGRPEGYVARQVDGWARRYAAARSASLPDLERAIGWLPAHLPAAGPAALIHNDYKYDNLVFDQADPTRVAAVLDWEMATIGDPLMDLGTTLAYWAEPGDPQALREFGLTSRPGNLNRQALVEAYAAHSGRDLGDVRFYYVFGLVKLAVIIQQIYARYLAGHTSDRRFAGLDRLVGACAEMAVRAIDRGRISDLA
jgi:aminoglycoside phosphotransferase (APT) family kinase protein